MHRYLQKMLHSKNIALPMDTERRAGGDARRNQGPPGRQMKGPALLKTAGNTLRQGQENLRRLVGLVKPGVGSQGNEAWRCCGRK